METSILGTMVMVYLLSIVLVATVFKIYTKLDWKKSFKYGAFTIFIFGAIRTILDITIGNISSVILSYALLVAAYYLITYFAKEYKIKNPWIMSLFVLLAGVGLRWVFEIFLW